MFNIVCISSDIWNRVYSLCKYSVLWYIRPLNTGNAAGNQCLHPHRASTPEMISFSVPQVLEKLAGTTFYSVFPSSPHRSYKEGIVLYRSKRESVRDYQKRLM